MQDFDRAQKYKRPPITEAVIGVVFASDVKSNDLDKLQKKFNKNYPNHQPLRQLNLHIEVTSLDSAPQNSLDEKIGHRRSNGDQTELIIIQENSFTVSQLAPYVGWDVFWRRFERDWALLKRSSGFRQIKQVGVRYINRIDIPFESGRIELKEYLKVSPEIPNSFGPIAAYSVSAQVNMDDMKSILRVNSAAVPSPLPNCASFLLDLDLIRAEDAPQSDTDLMQLLEAMRKRKNEFFEAAITDQTRSLFNHE